MWWVEWGCLIQRGVRRCFRYMRVLSSNNVFVCSFVILLLLSDTTKQTTMANKIRKIELCSVYPPNKVFPTHMERREEQKKKVIWYLQKLSLKALLGLSLGLYKDTISKCLKCRIYLASILIIETPDHEWSRTLKIILCRSPFTLVLK